MALNSFVDRSRLAQKISSAKNLSAQTVSNALFLQHPEWLDRFGERGRQSCADDIRFHIEFLAGAIEAGSPESFADYAQWTTNMLAARGIVGDSLKESFAQISHHLSGILSAEERTLVATFLNGESKAGTEAAPASIRGDPPDELKLARKVFLSAILSGQRQAALTVVEEALRCGCAMPDIYVEVFDQALHQVGRLWETNRITVAQEHMATAIAQFVIASVYPKIVVQGPPRGQMIVTGVSGELHQIGANLVADAMEAKGWDVHFLGSNLPSGAILDTVQENPTDVLCISTTLVANLPAAAELIELVRTRVDHQEPKIVVGGAAHRFTSHFADDLGVTGCATDLRAALALLCP